MSGPARADECGTAPDTCLRKAVSDGGSSRILLVADKPIKTTGKSKGGVPPTPGGVMKCQGGGGMTVSTGSGDGSGVFVNFTPAAQDANASPPGPGQCAWADRAFVPGEAHRLAFLTSKSNAQLLLQAVNGGAFQVTGNPVGTFIMVGTIDNVQVVDSTPLSPGPVGGNDDAGNGDVGPPMHADGLCGGPGAVATVVIPEPDLHKLNVRSKPGGQVLGTVPEGEQVTVVGPCGSQAAAGFAKSNKPIGGAAGWCQLDAPVSGCVMAKYLDFSGGGDDAAGLAPAAGFAMKPPKAGMTAPMGASFSGNWSANAQDVSYTLSLKQKGNGVSGSFQGSDGSVGTLNGKLQGNVLRFSWAQKDGVEGTGKFVLSDDGQSFEGSYKLSDNSAQGSWNGTRQ